MGGCSLEKDVPFIFLFLKLIAFLHKKNVSGFLPVKCITSSVLQEFRQAKTKEARGPLEGVAEVLLKSSSQTPTVVFHKTDSSFLETAAALLTPARLLNYQKSCEWGGE